MSAESFLFNFNMFMTVVFTMYLIMYLINKEVNYLIRREEVMKEKNSKFTERLKELRDEKGVTQREIAMELGMSQPNYRRWESGERSPSGETLIKLADYFDVSIDYLVGRKNEK